jgi:hypothetical protein
VVAPAPAVSTDAQLGTAVAETSDQR